VAVNAPDAHAWYACPSAQDEAIGGICPDGNMCCYDASAMTSTCISGKNATSGECCSDTIEDSTGCSEGFQCAHNNTSTTTSYDYCSRVDPNDDSLPEAVPRYRLCSVQPGRILKEVYGLLMAEDDSDSTRGVAAYLSTKGSIDGNESETLIDQAGVETAWIVVHGSSRNADDYVCCAVSALALDKRIFPTTTMIVAPWFLAPRDKPVNITFPSKSNYVETYTALRWAEQGPIEHTWRYGANAVGHNVSSYAVVDELIRRLVLDHERFPALKQIVVAGHSAGGQYVQRWALLSNGAAFANPAASYIPRVPTRIVVANPKSFCWLDGRRVFNGTLRKPEDDAVYICPTYDEWEWGFQNSTKSSERDELKAPYVHSAIKDAGGIDAVVDRYPSRDIVYLAGEMDVLHNGDCEEKMQGPCRRVRSASFYASLREIYGRPVHRRLVVAGVHHDHCLMFQSPEGRQALFGSFLQDEVAYS
jgi:pimeloyl-ACP methyl ester carboxylesterase